MKQRTKRLTVLCLTVLLLLTICSQAFAMRMPEHVHSESEELSPDVTVTYNPDGSETYDIELTAESAADQTTSEPDTIVDQGTHFENTGNEVDLRIEKEYTEGQPLVTVGAEGASVSFYPVVEQNGESATPPVTAEQQPSDDSVLLEGLFDEGTDIKLYATQRGVKEDIIVAAYTGNHVYPYRMTFDGVMPVQMGNEIQLFSGEQLVGRIVAPYMCDAAGETSTDIRVDFQSLATVNTSLSIRRAMHGLPILYAHTPLRLTRILITISARQPVRRPPPLPRHTSMQTVHRPIMAAVAHCMRAVRIRRLYSRTSVPTY